MCSFFRRYWSHFFNFSGSNCLVVISELLQCRWPPSRVFLLVSLVFFALAPEQCFAITVRTKVTPVQKVTELLQNLIVKASEEKGAEKRIYTDFTTKTNDAVTQLGYELETLETRIHVQSADKESAESELGQTQERLSNLGVHNVLFFFGKTEFCWKCPSQAKLTRAQEQLDTAERQRANEKSMYDVNFKDVSESVDALQRAIDVVSSRSDADGTALLQKMSKNEPAMHRVMVALLQEQRSASEQPAGEVYVKETSHRLVEVLKKLLTDFSGQKQSLSQMEENQAHAFELTKEDLTHEIEHLTRSQAQEVAAAAAFREQIASLKVAIRDDQARMEWFAFVPRFANCTITRLRKLRMFSLHRSWRPIWRSRRQCLPRTSRCVKRSLLPWGMR